MEWVPSGFLILSTGNSSVIFPALPHNPDTRLALLLPPYRAKKPTKKEPFPYSHTSLAKHSPKHTGGFEVMGTEEVKTKFNIQTTEQVIDMLGLMVMLPTTSPAVRVWARKPHRN